MCVIHGGASLWVLQLRWSVSFLIYDHIIYLWNFLPFHGYHSLLLFMVYCFHHPHSPSLHLTHLLALMATFNLMYTTNRWICLLHDSYFHLLCWLKVFQTNGNSGWPSLIAITPNFLTMSSAILQYLERWHRENSFDFGMEIWKYASMSGVSQNKCQMHCWFCIWKS